METPSVPVDMLGGEHREVAGSDQGGDVDITEKAPAINRDEEALEQGPWTSEESEEIDPESDLDDNTSAENFEITEGGWICRVERFEKHVDSQGYVTYHHPRKETSPPPVSQDSSDIQYAEAVEPDEIERDVKQSIISYFHHAAKATSGDLIEHEIWIEIKSPLILEVLRRNKSYRVWLCLSHYLRVQACY